MANSKRLTMIFKDSIRLIIICFLFACKEDNRKLMQNGDLGKILSLQTSLSASKLAKSGAFITVDSNAIKEYLYKHKKLNDLQAAQIKAATYRFYSHVKVVNGLYAIDIDKPADINVSDYLFNMHINSLEQGNEWIEEQRKQGVETKVTAVDSAYLNSLLK